MMLFDLMAVVNHGFAGKTIPDLFSSLPSLQGLFLGTYMYEYSHGDDYCHNMTHTMTSCVWSIWNRICYQEEISSSGQYLLHGECSETWSYFGLVRDTKIKSTKSNTLQCLQ